MSTKIKNQLKDKVTHKKKMDAQEKISDIEHIDNSACMKDSPNIDVILLSNLYTEITKVNMTLDVILNKLCVNYVQMAQIKKNLGSSPIIWKLEEAKELLEVVIMNAVLGKEQIVEYREWLVKVSCAES